MLKKIALILIVLFVTTSVMAQRRGQCLGVKEAELLLKNLSPLSEETSFFLPDDGNVFHGNSLSTMKINYPIVYLFYQKGFLKLDYNGNTFSDLTNKGRQLKTRYPRGIPLSTQEIVTVTRVTCTKSKAQVYVTLRARPTQVALDLLGSSVLQVEPFNKSQKKVVILIKRNGNWLPDDNAASAVTPNLN